MRLLSVFLFIFTFTIEVRVRASDQIIETPEKCVEEKGYCTIKNLGSKYLYNGNGYSLSLKKESIVVRQKEKEWSFVKGQIFVTTSDKLVLDIPYGQIEVDKDTKVLIEKTEDKFTVQTIFGKVFLRPLGEKKPVLVMAGHENYISQVGASLKAQTGIPKPILVESLLRSWAFHSPDKKEKFLEDVESFKSVHEKAVHDLSILNEQIASREIASDRAEKLAAKERAIREKNRKEKMQETYYNRLLSGSDSE